MLAKIMLLNTLVASEILNIIEEAHAFKVFYKNFDKESLADNNSDLIIFIKIKEKDPIDNYYNCWMLMLRSWVNDSLLRRRGERVVSYAGITTTL